MGESSQTIQVSREGTVHEATVTWWRAGTRWTVWTVAVESAVFDRTEATADDAFEALCRVREVLEPQGWRLGVAGAQPDVWPSGMARDQGGGLGAYRMTTEQVEGMVGTFEPVDPATVVTVTEQRAETTRLLDEIRQRLAEG